METLFRAADSEVSVDLTVQAANLLSEKFSSQAKKLINLSKNTVQSALEIQQRIVMPSSENSEYFFHSTFCLKYVMEYIQVLQMYSITYFRQNSRKLFIERCFNTSYLTDSYISFTLKLESRQIFCSNMLIRSSTYDKKIFLIFLQAGAILF